MRMRPAPPRSPDRAASRLDTVPAKMKVIAGIGGIYETFSTHGPRQLALPVFNLTLGLPATWVGLGQGLPRLLESLFNPWIGHTTDHLQTRWGRRRPAMLTGAISSAICFALIWWFPRDMPPWFYFGYLLVTATLFHLAASCFTIPWEAMLVELSRDHHERTSLQVYRSIIATLGALLMPWMLATTQSPLFADTIEGVRVVGLLGAGLLLVAGAVPALFVREPAPVAPREAPPSVSWRLSLREAMRQRPLRILIGMMLLYGPGVVLTEDFGLYINVYHVFNGDLPAASYMEGFQGTLFYAGKFLWVPVMGLVARRLGKHWTLLLCFAFSALSDILNWFCYTPSHPYLQLIPSLVQSVGMAPAWVLMFSMLADVLDVDERTTGRRRAGLFVAVSQWIRKMGMALALALSGGLLAATGFSVLVQMQPEPAVVTRIRILFTVVPLACTLLAMWLTRKYEHALKEQKERCASILEDQVRA